MDDKTTATDKLTHEQLDIVNTFLDLIFSDNVEEYWELISKVDQARVYGMYRDYIQQPGARKLTFYSYISNHIKPDHEKNFEMLRDNNLGVSNVVRYTNAGEPIVYILKNIQVPVYFIAPTEAEACRLVLTVDANVKNSQIIANWKVRLYEDTDYEKLNV